MTRKRADGSERSRNERYRNAEKEMQRKRVVWGR
jgi:hypothetical protein